MKKYFHIIFMVAFLIFNSISSGADMKQVIEKDFQMESGGQISIRGDDGFIKIKSWDKEEVHLTITKRAWARSKKDAEKILEYVEIRIHDSANRLNIQTITPNENKNISFWDLFDPDTWGEHRRKPTVDFELTVPRKINIDIKNDEGNIDIDDIEGDIDINVDEGDINLQNIQFHLLKLESDEGDIEGRKLNGTERGRITINSDEGKITLDKISTNRLKIDSDEGDVYLKRFLCSSCDVSTDEGYIELNISNEQDSQYNLRSDDGRIICYLPGNPDIKFDLETESGYIRSDFDIDIHERGDKWRCRDSLGNGKSILEAYTDDGDIYIRKQ